MSQLVHSPSPWRCSTHGSGPDRTDILSGDTFVCDALNQDAPLISAAPDLLEALIEITNRYTPCQDGGIRAVKQARAAISKAEGKA